MPSIAKTDGTTVPEPDTFEIGLVLAGAISAGAYTAGVMDFLMEALDAIEDVRAGRNTSHLQQGSPHANPVFPPPHQVKIKALSGASAGGMVAAIATATFGAHIDPVAGPQAPAPDQPVNNPFYDSWVRRVGIQAMLETTDIQKTKKLRSLLNVRDLSVITKEALAFSKHTERTRDYISDKLAIFLCLGNQRGVRYALPLKSGQVGASEHEMSMHADYITFRYGPQAEGASPGTPSPLPDALPLVPGSTANWERWAMPHWPVVPFPSASPRRSLSGNSATTPRGNGP